MDIYRSNLEFMEKYTPVLYKTIQEEQPIYPSDIFETNLENNFQIKYNNKTCFANSCFSVEDELDETFQSVNKNCEVLILFGIGNGESIKYIKNSFRNLKALFIVEPFITVFKEYVKRNVFRDVFVGMGEISVLVNKNENDSSQLIIDIFTEGRYTEVEVVALASYASLLGGYYNVLKERVLRGFRSKLMQLVTLNNTKYKWLNNAINNYRFPHIMQEDISGFLRGKPAVIVGAGPSLNKQFQLLKELKEKAIIIGASSAIKILNSNDITPHFKMVIDAYPDKSIYDDSFYENSKEVPLLYASQSYDDVVMNYDGKKILMILPTDVFGQYICEKLELSYEFVRSGASVVQSAFSFLAQAGCNPIILIGQDMCFYEHEVYASGINSIDQDYFDAKGWIKQKDIYGNDVFTVRNYIQIKYDYETLLKDYPNTRVINATEGGLGIENTEIMALSQVMNEVLPNKLDIDFEPKIDQIWNEKKHSELQFHKVFTEVLEEINQILEINKKRFDFLKKLTRDRENKAKINRLYSDLKYIDINIGKQLGDIGFFREVVKSNIVVQSIALKHIYISSEDETPENLIQGEKYLYGIASEVEVFCSVCKDWIEAYLEDVKNKQGNLVAEENKETIK